MTKYARVRDGALVDVYSVPGDFPSLERLNRCLPGGGFIEVPTDKVEGAKVADDGTITNPEPNALPPAIAPKTGMEKILERLDSIEAKIEALSP